VNRVTSPGRAILETLVLGRGRPWLFLGVALVTLVAGWRAAGLRPDDDNTSMVSADRSMTSAETAFARDFGDDEVIVVALTHPDLLGPDGLATLRTMTERIGGLDGVRRATSLTNVRRIVRGPAGAEPAPLVPEGPAGDDGRAALRTALDANPHLTGFLVSADRRTAAIVVECLPRPGDGAWRARLVEALRRLAAEPRAAGVEVHLTGLGLQKHDTAVLVQRDQRVLLPLAVAVLGLALVVVTRRLDGVVLPLVVTGAATVWTLGLYAARGHSVNVITALLPPLVMVLSVATSIHLFEAWAGSESDPDSAARLRVALRHFGGPCFMTALTSALGMASLLTSDLPAVRLFGGYGAVGIMLSYLLNITLLPAVLSYRRAPAPAARPARDRAGLWLEAVARVTARHPRWTLLLALVPTVVALAGLPRIRNNTDLLRFLGEEAPLVRDTRAIDAALGGANGVDLTIERRDGAPLTRLDDIRRIERFVEAVGSLPEVTGTLALTDLLKQMQRAEGGDAVPALPGDSATLTGLFDLLEAAEDQTDIRRVATADFRRARVAVRLRLLGTHDAAALFDRLETLASEDLGPDYRVAPIGPFYRVTVDSNRLVAGQVQSFGLALLTVILSIGLAVRSWRLLVAAIVPNVVPIVWTMGTMGWCGIDLSTATTMVASVVLGIAVDDEILYLAAFKSGFRGNLEETIVRTTRNTGRAIAISTAVLTLGFLVGAFSSFRPTVYFSLLAGLSMIAALLCTMTLLPACLAALHPRPGNAR
jgi:predicted RND superfamily exporter protein